MEKKALKRIFDFLEEKGEHNAPVKWKLINNIPLTDDELTFYDDDLDLIALNIETLPEGLKINHSLYLNDCEDLISLPKGLKVGGWLKLPNTKITSLPEDLEVGESLNLRFCTELTSLPKGLKVGGDLYIYGTPLNEIEDDDEIREMIKPGFIKGEIVR